MTEIREQTVTTDGVERHETIETNGAPSTTKQTLEKGVHHGDQEAQGALGGAVVGAGIGAVLGGPVGAVIGGAVGAATGTTAGALDSKRKDEEVVVTKEEKTW
jgi:outer membrane lipoprotein SlyB